MHLSVYIYLYWRYKYTHTTIPFTIVYIHGLKLRVSIKCFIVTFQVSIKRALKLRVSQWEHYLYPHRQRCTFCIYNGVHKLTCSRKTDNHKTLRIKSTSE